MNYMKTKGTIVRVIILATILILFIAYVAYVNIKPLLSFDSDSKMVPISGYAYYIAEDVTAEDDYVNADIDTRMDLFYDYLMYICENGYEVGGENYKALILYPDEIRVDRQNKIISFVEHYSESSNPGRVFRYDFVNECVINVEHDAMIQQVLEEVGMTQ